MTDPRDTPETTTMRRLKRSRALQVSSLMATVGFSMAACGSPQTIPVREAEAPPSLAYTSLDECKAANDLTDEQCDQAQAEARRQAESTGPRYVSREACEDAWGAGQCQTWNTGSGGSMFMPLVTGFIVGQMLSGGRYAGGGPLYRTRDDQYLAGGGGGGGVAYRDYRTGRTYVRNRDADGIREAPQRVQSRTTVVSRGGFGGGGRGFGG